MGGLIVAGTLVFGPADTDGDGLTEILSRRAAPVDKSLQTLQKRQEVAELFPRQPALQAFGHERDC